MASDILNLFFEDISRVPILKGINDYLPLTRRVQRYMVLTQTVGELSVNGWQRYKTRLRTSIETVYSAAYQNGLPKPELEKLGRQIDVFLDSPALTNPPALTPVLSLPQCPETVTIEAWQLVYLLSLVPPEHRLAPLTHAFGKEIADYWKETVNEGQQARHKLSEGTLRYILTIAQNYIGRGLPFLDLVQEGFFGLWRAMETYEERFGTHFQHHAGAWIRQRIERAIAEQSRLVRIPVHALEKMRIVSRVAEDYADTYGGMPTTDELSRLLTDFEVVDDESETPDPKAKQKLLEYFLQYGNDLVSLDDTRLKIADPRQHGRQLTLDTLLHTALDYDKADHRMFVEQLREIFRRRLTERDRVILEKRLGLYDGHEYTLEEIGHQLKVTRERVRQIEANALKRISFFTKPLFESYHYIDPRTPETYVSTHLSRLLRIVLARESAHLGELQAVEERQQVRELMKRHVRRARNNRYARQQGQSRSDMLYEALLEIGKPATYQAIYREAIDLFGEAITFDEAAAYRTIYYSPRFRRLGNGIFGPAESTGNPQSSLDTESRLQICPMPLAPKEDHPTAFLESVIEAGHNLSKRPMTATAFWFAMLSWANRADVSVENAQGAFDAWYAVGLIDHTSMADNGAGNLELRLPVDVLVAAATNLAPLREYCLNMLCQRVALMGEVLSALAYIPRPTVSSIAEIAFGPEMGTFDMPNRLKILIALGAVRNTDGAYHLTELGRAIQAKYAVELSMPTLSGEPAPVEMAFDEWDMFDV